MDDPRAPPGWSAGATSSAPGGPFGSDDDLYLISGELADPNGSTYFVERKTRFDQLDVTTTRPDGFEIHKYIRAHPSGGRGRALGNSLRLGRERRR